MIMILGTKSEQSSATIGAGKPLCYYDTPWGESYLTGVSREPLIGNASFLSMSMGLILLMHAHVIQQSAERFVDFCS